MRHDTDVHQLATPAPYSHLPRQRDTASAPLSGMALDPSLTPSMRDIKNPAVIWVKGVLFLTLGLASAVLLLAETHTIRVGALWALSVWGFCRAYYFAFYVIERYVDPGYRFSGLMSFVGYLLRKRAHD